jgi:hypothetical protein
VVNRLPLRTRRRSADRGAGIRAVNWDLFARAGAGRLEVVRSSSYIRGDARPGAVNLLTDGSAPSRSWRLAGGCRHSGWQRFVGTGQNQRAAGLIHCSSQLRVSDSARHRRSTVAHPLRRIRRAVAVHRRIGTTSMIGAAPSTITTGAPAISSFARSRAERVHRGGISIVRALGSAKGRDISSANTQLPAPPGRYRCRRILPTPSSGTQLREFWRPLSWRWVMTPGVRGDTGGRAGRIGRQIHISYADVAGCSPIIRPLTARPARRPLRRGRRGRWEQRSRTGSFVRLLHYESH